MANAEDGAGPEKLREMLFRKLRLEGKTAVVTGGGSGIGRRMGTVLGALGAAVFFADIDAESARAAAAEAKSTGGGQAFGVAVDVTKTTSVGEAFRQVQEAASGCDILVCCAGVSAARWIEDMDVEAWRRVIEVNLTGTFLCCQAAARVMIANRWGRIVNLASIASRFAPKPDRFNGGYNYSASKAGVVGMSRRLAVELAPYGITVNCISPGILRTPLTEKAVSEEDTYRQIIAQVPLRRLGCPEDLDGLIMYLCSELSDFLTGQEILIDGGYSLW
jgi:NAD(P)-dependent dehydrogenase (short-subunit alcohol dehydrogenase family)